MGRANGSACRIGCPISSTRVQLHRRRAGAQCRAPGLEARRPIAVRSGSAEPQGQESRRSGLLEHRRRDRPRSLRGCRGRGARRGAEVARGPLSGSLYAHARWLRLGSVYDTAVFVLDKYRERAEESERRASDAILARLGRFVTPPRAAERKRGPSRARALSESARAARSRKASPRDVRAPPESARAARGRAKASLSRVRAPLESARAARGRAKASREWGHVGLGPMGRGDRVPSVKWTETLNGC